MVRVQCGAASCLIGYFSHDPFFCVNFDEIAILQHTSSNLYADDAQRIHSPSITSFLPSGWIYASFPGTRSRYSAISLGIRTAMEFPVLVTFVFLPRPQMPLRFAASSIRIVVASSVNDSPHF